MTNDAGEARGYGGSELAKGKCSAGNLSPHTSPWPWPSHAEEDGDVAGPDWGGGHT